MHLKSLHTIWLTLFTALVLLVSSVANSAPMMNIQMISSGMMSHSPSNSMTDDEDCGMSKMVDAAMMHYSEAKESDMNCGSAGMVHTCCTAACTIVFVPLPIPASQASPIIYRATIATEPTSPVVHVSRDLYRPPIA
ncbi:hypothetical protein D1115_20995 [Vibrio alfacsensis]|uniref:DUF2946 domain-containing protein n=1 Tax=Vibrio alfacsensis TaxID=1074311 RepID=A0ABN5PJJ7_9VIBR|nr:hypothetical protein [Vibrio alfacsensis]AXY03348.1 hypothetical protein D1115_20995 [Vibrio alfacsensis]